MGYRSFRVSAPRWNRRFPSLKTLAVIGLDKCFRDKALALLQKDEPVEVEPGYEVPPEDAVLRLANECMGTFGVESLRSTNTITRWYWEDIVALYANTGDSYIPTLLYDIGRGAFLVTSWGDWVDTAERTRRYRFE